MDELIRYNVEYTFDGGEMRTARCIVDPEDDGEPIDLIMQMLAVKHSGNNRNAELVSVFSMTPVKA